MGLNNVSFEEKSVLNGVVRGGGSTSETLSAGFVTGQLSLFDQEGYRNLHQAWSRLNAEQQQAVIDLRKICRMGRHDPEIGGVVVPNIKTFVDEFILWKNQCFIDKRVQRYCELNEDSEDFEGVPDAVMKVFQSEFNVMIQEYL